LADGTYTVRVVAASLPAGLTNTFGGAQQAATVLNASTDLSKDFGYQPSGTISGRVFNDADGDGAADAGEPGIPGAVVELVDSNGNVVATTTTGPDGSYTFDHLPDGAYTVRVQPGSVPAGLNATTPTSIPANIVGGADVSGLNFGYDSPTGAIGDRVWFDVDGDGVQDAGEAGIPGVTLELLNAAGQVIATEVTNSAGGYLFDGLADGTYTVRVVAATLPAGLTNTFGGAQQSATLTNASSDLSKDFGYRTSTPPPPPPPGGAIGDRVWADTDGDGVQDTDELGLPGVTVQLLNAAGQVIASDVTDDAGGYLFTGLANGVYTVRVVAASVPPGLASTTGGLQQTATVVNASSDLARDFGFGAPRGALGGRVWLDADGDGLQDPSGEPGLVGVTVELLDAAGRVVATQLTGPSGTYVFPGLPDGAYQVRVVESTLPAGLSRTFPASATVPATVRGGSTDLTNDFGYRTAPPTCDPGTDPRVHEACFEASVWLADPHTREFDVYVRVDRGTRAGDIRDLVSFGYTGAFPGTAVGANGVLRVEGLTVVDGYAKVRVCVTAEPGEIDDGFFDGPFRLEVVVNGIGEAAADTFTRTSLVPGATFPRAWTPLWCDDVPDFAVTSVVPFACWEPPAPPTTCVRDVAWWRAVHRDGACAATRVPWPLDGAEGRRLCGRTWRSILDASARDDAWVALAQAYIAAQLNVAAGNTPSRKVADAIDEAGCLLVQGCRGFCGLAEERAVLLHRTLKAFNRGNNGPPACAGAVPTCPPPPDVCPVPDAGPSKDRPRKDRDDDRPSKGGKPRKGDDRR
ncbi:MAG: carboxypeptidase regulatory-like domain-containing protein, partial [Planctomycetia bacterium]|nr:carboxypeptidase regulatory-like domain-containing protein [Planctomycetia bacterium]